jgi:NAD(P)-dependent dehydrogenase (short-subunit alcohol dehydrogenase family)
MTRPVAIVTGGARGIGLAIAEALADSGHDLVIADLAREAGEDLTNRIVFHGARVAYCQCDISDLAAHARLVETALSAFGRIDCLVGNAGIGAPVRGDLLELQPENFDKVLSVNLRGTIFLTQAVAKAMLAAASTHPRSIVTITSISAEAASPERADYCISKAGLSMWVKNLALRLAPHDIGVFEVRPGIIRTDMTAGVAAKYDALIEAGLVPARRWGEAADVAAAVSALASGKFGFATGSVINADGALSIPRL